MAHVLLVVSRDAPELLARLTKEFAGVQGIKVVADRRVKQRRRRRPGPAAPSDAGATAGRRRSAAARLAAEGWTLADAVTDTERPPSTLVLLSRTDPGKIAELLDAIQTLSRELDLTRLLQIIMDKASRLLNADRSSLFVVDEAARGAVVEDRAGAGGPGDPGADRPGHRRPRGRHRRAREHRRRLRRPPLQSGRRSAHRLPHPRDPVRARARRRRPRGGGAPAPQPPRRRPLRRRRRAAARRLRGPGRHRAAQRPADGADRGTPPDLRAAARRHEVVLLGAGDRRPAAQDHGADLGRAAGRPLHAVPGGPQDPGDLVQGRPGQRPGGNPGTDRARHRRHRGGHRRDHQHRRRLRRSPLQPGGRPPHRLPHPHHPVRADPRRPGRGRGGGPGAQQGGRGLHPRRRGAAGRALGPGLHRARQRPAVRVGRHDEELQREHPVLHGHRRHDPRPGGRGDQPQPGAAPDLRRGRSAPPPATPCATSSTPSTTSPSWRASTPARGSARPTPSTS